MAKAGAPLVEVSQFPIQQWTRARLKPSRGIAFQRKWTQLAARHLVDPLAGHHHRPGVGTVDASDQIEQRGFAGARDGFEPEASAKGERQIWVEAAVVDRLTAIRGSGESYSDVPAARGSSEGAGRPLKGRL